MNTPSKLAIRKSILEHVARYRLSVFPAVARLHCVANRPHKQIRSLLNGLCDLGHLGAENLYANRRYYYLTQNALTQIQSDPNDRARRYGPLSEEAKIRNYAMLAFCCLNGMHRQRLTKRDIATHFPQIDRPGLSLNYYVATSESQPRMGFIRVDVGGEGRWDRILAKCTEDLEAHSNAPGFAGFVSRLQFELTLITSLPQKASRLEQSLAQLGNLRPPPIRVVVIPELLNLIAPPPTRAYRQVSNRKGRSKK